MDRLAYIAMSAANEGRTMEATLANNLANANTLGYKADKVSFKSLYLSGASQTRVYAKTTGNAVDLSDGPLHTTAQPLDIALRGNAWLSVTAPDGKTGYVHTASMHVNSNGILETQLGYAVNSINGASITVPLKKPVTVDKSGNVSVMENGQPNVLDQLKIVALPEKDVTKGPDAGMVQLGEGAAAAKPLEHPGVLAGTLEQSNVSSVETLVRMMEVSQQYEAGVSMMMSAKKNDMNENELLQVR